MYIYSELNDAVFSGLANTEYLSLADNELRSVPRNVLRHMPNLKTLDMGRDKISSLSATDLQVRARGNCGDPH